MQIVLPLVDANMVTDPAWRHWLTSLKRSGCILFPVALDATAYNLPSPVRDLNYLRPSGIPPPNEELTPAQFDVVARSLLKQLTEAVCRVLLPKARLANVDPSDSGASSPKITIFLSHAKADGTRPARRLRDYVYGQTQLAVFYDENDIAYGSIFSQLIKQGLTSTDTAALIAVRSALYATRPWCRREVSLFRTPKPHHDGDNMQRWGLYPTVVVEAMEGSQMSLGVPEFGSSSVIRWRDDDATLEELIVTTAMRDAMLAAFYTTLGATISAAPGRIVINWLPDPMTLLQIPSVRSQQPCEIVYPGRSLSGLELDTLYELFPQATFRSFDQVLA
jgi:hypothetical protein